MPIKLIPIQEKEGVPSFLPEKGGTNSAIKEKEILKFEKADQEKENYVEGKINWLNDPFYDSWDKIKGHSKKLWEHKKSILEEEDLTEWKKFFLAHSKDTITGKPQLIEQVQKKIPLVRLAIKTIKKTEDGEKMPAMDIQSYYFFDERFDKRYDGYQKDCFSLDFWLYRLIENGKEFYIYSQERLSSENCTLEGMVVELSDTAELSNSLKVNSVSRIFFVKKCDPSVKIMLKEEIINITQSNKITLQDWFDFIELHPLGNYNRFPEDIRYLRSAFILSGKKDGYPLHLSIWGKSGTKKTMGHIETLHSRFNEAQSISAGAMSTLKGLIPSFQKRPADIGYIAKCFRFAPVDEIGKLIEKESSKHDGSAVNIMGYLNDLLEHKDRLAGSGNESCQTKATAKCLFVSNPITNRPNIYAIIALVDNTTLSRMLIWVQDEEETTFCLSNEAVELPPILSQSYIYEKEKNVLLLKKYRGEVLNKNFLSLFDTCYSFTCTIPKEKVDLLVKSTSALAREPMKSSVWLPRASHHIYLLLDGLIKTRCLFKDYDSSFSFKQEDYDLAERILIRMVKGWDTDLSPKQEAYR